MKILYQPQIDEVREAALLLEDFSNPEGSRILGERTDREASNLALDRERRKSCKDVQRILERLRREARLTAQEREWFKPDHGMENGRPTASSLLFALTFSNGVALEKIEQAVAGTTPGRIRAYFARVCLQDDDWLNTQAGDEELSMEAFVQAVMKEETGLRPEDKCHVLGVFAAYQTAFSTALDAVRRMLALLQSARSEWQPILQRWDEKARLACREGSELMEKISASIPLLKQWPHDLCVRPALSDYTGVRVWLKGQDPSAFLPGGLMGLLSIGLSFWDFQSPHLEAITDAERNLALKLLSDKSKFDILLALRQGPCYGAQLAQKLKLSAATISHHMAALLSLRLVQYDAQDNRIYYRLDRKRLEELLRRLQSDLLE